jgi:hypothetical protein
MGKIMKRLNLIYLMLLALILWGSSCKDANITKSTFKMWDRSETASMIKSGMELILVFDETKQEFTGTVENQNATVAKRARVEVHTFDANGNAMFEYGPTTPVDMQPGEIRNLVLPAPTAGNFVTFSMHPEIG